VVVDVTILWSICVPNPALVVSLHLTSYADTRQVNEWLCGAVRSSHLVGQIGTLEAIKAKQVTLRCGNLWVTCIGCNWLEKKIAFVLPVITNVFCKQQLVLSGMLLGFLLAGHIFHMQHMLVGLIVYWGCSCATDAVPPIYYSRNFEFRQGARDSSPTLPK